MIDLRCKQFAWKERMNSLKGIPSALSLGQEANRVVVGTQRGFIDVFDAVSYTHLTLPTILLV